MNCLAFPLLEDSCFYIWMINQIDRLNLENVHKALKCPCLETDHNVARALKDPTHRLAAAGPGGKYKWVLACIEL